MKEFSVEKSYCESLTALSMLREAEVVNCYPAYIGLDVHKDTIAVSVARSEETIGRYSPFSPLAALSKDLC